MDAVNKAIESSSLNSGINQFATHITDASLAHLEHTAEILSSNTFELTADLSKLNVVWGQINSLYDEVRSDLSMDRQLKNFILRQLESIRGAISNYEITGTSPILDAIHSFTGAAQVQPEIQNQIKKTKFGTKIATILAMTYILVDPSANIRKISQNMSEATRHVKESSQNIKDTYHIVSTFTDSPDDVEIDAAE